MYSRDLIGHPGAEEKLQRKKGKLSPFLYLKYPPELKGLGIGGLFLFN